MIYGNKFRQNKPGSPHLNSKVDLLLAEWQHYYSWERPNSSLNGLTAIDRVTGISVQTPLSEEVSQHYQIKKERFQEQKYKLALQLEN